MSPRLTSPSPELAWCPLSAPECGPINLLHMELLHHFERYSITTLPFQEVWPRMLQLAFYVCVEMSLFSHLLPYTKEGQYARSHQCTEN